MVGRGCHTGGGAYVGVCVCVVVGGAVSCGGGGGGGGCLMLA